MSNYLAIATVTYTLAEMLQPVLQAVVPSASVKVGRPENMDRAGTAFVGANLYLYRVEPNAAFRNADLATRAGTGALLQRPQAAIDLFYLISFYGNDMQLETQRLMGGAVTLLHAQPVLMRERVRAAIDQNAGSATPFLTDSDLDQQVELVRLTPLSLSLDELSKLWTVFFQVAHAPSIAYQASVVLLEADGVPQRALPVRSAATSSQVAPIPRIRQIVPPLVPFAPNAEITLLGENLAGDEARARFGDLESPVRSGPDGSAITRLPPGLPAGMNSVSVVRRLVESNQAPFVVQPALAGPISFARLADPRTAAQIDTIQLAITPEPGLRQRVDLLLNEYKPADGAAHLYSFDTLLRCSIGPRAAADLDAARASQALREAFRGNGIELSRVVEVTVTQPGQQWRIADRATGQRYRLVLIQDRIVVYYALAEGSALAFQVRDVAPGTYLVRVQIDGVQYAESRLALGADGSYAAPLVSVPDEAL